MCTLPDCLLDQLIAAPDLDAHELKDMAGRRDAEGRCLLHSTDHGWYSALRPSGFVRTLITLADTCTSIPTVRITHAQLSDPSDQIDLGGLVLSKELHFKKVEFMHPLNAERMVLPGADHFKVTFHGEVRFNGTRYLNYAKFNECEFLRRAYFNDCVFADGTNGVLYTSFNQSTFHSQANFPNTKFLGTRTHANLQLIHFKENAYFSTAEFSGPTLWNGTRCDGVCELKNTVFRGKADLKERDGHQVRFEELVLTEARFLEGAVWDSVTIGRGAFQRMEVSGAFAMSGCHLHDCAFDALHVRGTFTVRDCTLSDVAFSTPRVDPDGILHFVGHAHLLDLGRNATLITSADTLLGRIRFDNVDLRPLARGQVDRLKELELRGNVTFDARCVLHGEREIMRFPLLGASSVPRELCARWTELIENVFGPERVSIRTDTASEVNVLRAVMEWSDGPDLQAVVQLTSYFLDRILNARQPDRALLEHILLHLPDGKALLGRAIRKEAGGWFAYARRSIVEAIRYEKDAPDLLAGPDTADAQARPPFAEEAFQRIVVALEQWMQHTAEARQLPPVVQATNISNSTITIFQGQVTNSPVTIGDSKAMQEALERLAHIVDAMGTNDTTLKAQGDLLQQLSQAARTNDKRRGKQVLGQVAAWVWKFASEVGTNLTADMVARFLGW